VSEPLTPGMVIWVSLDPTVGREQAGTRPAVVVASAGYLRAVQELAIVVPVTTTNRRWPHHVELRGEQLALPETSYAMTEQPRTISRARITGRAGYIDEGCAFSIRQWLDDFLS